MRLKQSSRDYNSASGLEVPCSFQQSAVGASKSQVEEATGFQSLVQLAVVWAVNCLNKACHPWEVAPAG